MITGSVIHDGREPVIAIDVRGPTGRTLHAEAVIDTGFTSFLTLRQHEIDGLKLPWITRIDANLADGSTIKADVYEGEVKWDGVSLQIQIAEADTKPLVGMSLMKNYRLTIDVLPNGRLALERIASAPN
jgi:clan AA aspartic protease